MSKKPPFFSVVIPAYNRADFLLIATLSLQQQSFPDWEVIIIDDGSTDHTSKVCQRLLEKDGRIKYHYQKNQERSAARNKGIHLSQGEYICFLDSDDYYLPQHLEIFHTKIIEQKRPKAFLYSKAVAYIRKEYHKGKTLMSGKTPIRIALEDFLYPTSACFHKNILKKIKFPEAYNMWEDTHLFIRVLLEYDFIPIEAFTTVRVEHEDMSTHDRFLSFENMTTLFECVHDLTQNYLAGKPKIKKAVQKFQYIMFCDFSVASLLSFQPQKMFKTIGFLRQKKILSEIIFYFFKKPHIPFKILLREILAKTNIYKNTGLGSVSDEEKSLYDFPKKL